MNKTPWLDAAHVFDAWRVVPRIVLFSYGAWVAHVTDKTLEWYYHLPGAERTLEASGLAAAIITAITGLFPWVYKIYSDNGVDWFANPQTRQTTVVASTQTVQK